ncbi:3',5'-cyclic AMP phosphodiesterase CpdA [Aeromicrobium panaciterrae]|uniref:3',5'-cyclic AMP phosphodiesterase CpdA n=1 Tax=Aeromicrobium panaciterrae TaxID=363861 RepID=A0ABU1UPW7_9ACTN|nr:metallophosphoesterase [Aeromicrobium panaciterrae]MDR7087221.1 3',5'-cyclic AMP phosphodiesterase CpdA [Aeromicrobium panaciterrae]
MQLGQHAPASHVIAHVSDTHFGHGTAAVYSNTDPAAYLEATMRRLAIVRPDAIVFTGDIADHGEPEAYEAVASIVVDAAAEMGAELIWVMGNHDAREPFSRRLLGRDGDPEAPIDQVFDINGLRVIALDTTIPGYHDGELSATQLEWLREELASPAPHGTLLAMHHPPIATHLQLMTIIELADQHLLADAIEDTDVRTILAGHYHYSAHSTLGSVPVSVAASTCYIIDPAADPRGLRGYDGSQSFDLAHVFADRIVHSTVPVQPGRLVVDYPLEALEHVAAMTPADRRENFAKASVDIDSMVMVDGDTLET